MNFIPDIAGDCLLVDGTETVTLHGESLVVVAGAKRGPLVLAEIEFRQLGVETTDLAWNLPEVNLSGVVPRRGDTLEDDAGAFWVVHSAVRSPLSRVWRLVTRRQI
jgi:hypothetical protein